MSLKIDAPQVINGTHLIKVNDWYHDYSYSKMVLCSSESQTIFLVQTTEGEIQLARVFSFGERVDISIDYKGTNSVEDIQQLILNFKRVAMD